MITVTKKRKKMATKTKTKMTKKRKGRTMTKATAKTGIARQPCSTLKI
jgi:hypothetical protein